MASITVNNLTLEVNDDQKMTYDAWSQQVDAYAQDLTNAQQHRDERVQPAFAGEGMKAMIRAYLNVLFSWVMPSYNADNANQDFTPTVDRYKDLMIDSFIVASSRITVDWQNIQNLFFTSDQETKTLESLQVMESTGSDLHFGKQVIKLKFKLKVGMLDFFSETAAQLIYKPSDIGVDLFFSGDTSHLTYGNGQWHYSQQVNNDPANYSIAEMVNAQKPYWLPVYTIWPVLSGNDSGNYGYMTFLTSDEADINTDEAQNIDHFYRDYGRLAAIGWAFGSTDMHYDNFITHGLRPFPIDQENTFSRPTGWPGTLLIGDKSPFTNPNRKNSIFLNNQMQRYGNYINTIATGCYEMLNLLGQMHQAITTRLNDGPNLVVRTVPRSTYDYGQTLVLYNLITSLTNINVVQELSDEETRIRTSDIQKWQQINFKMVLDDVNRGIQASTNMDLLVQETVQARQTAIRVRLGVGNWSLVTVDAILAAQVNTQQDVWDMLYAFANLLEGLLRDKDYDATRWNKPNFNLVTWDFQQYQLLSIPYYTHKIKDENLLGVNSQVLALPQLQNQPPPTTCRQTYFPEAAVLFVIRNLEQIHNPGKALAVAQKLEDQLTELHNG